MNADDLKLPRKSRELYDLLAGKGDVNIVEIYEALGGAGERDHRYSQQWVGAYVTALNRRLKNHHLRVKPGQMKRTYALVAV